MATKAELKRFRRLRDEAEDALASKLAELEEVQDRISKKRERKEDWDRDSRRFQELSDDIEELVRRRKRLKARIEKLEGLVKKYSRKAKRAARRLRNRFKPKVIDLALWRTAQGPLARQGSLNGTVGHYTAGPLDDDGDDEAISLWRAYDRAHKAQGWSCLGYPWGVTRDGTIVLLRGRQYVGAHTLGHNTGWDGCSVHGTTGDTWTKPQLRAFRYALKKFGTIDKPVYGHREMPGQSTACPGNFLAGYKKKGRT